MNAITLSRALGLFSIGLGLVELVAARPLARSLGTREARPLIRGFGLREIGTGLAILGSPAAPAGLWARVAGDALDLAALGRAAADPWNRRRGNALLAFAAVAGVTLLDIVVARQLQEREARARLTARRTRVDPAERPKAQPPARQVGRSATAAGDASGAPVAAEARPEPVPSNPAPAPSAH